MSKLALVFVVFFTACSDDATPPTPDSRRADASKADVAAGTDGKPAGTDGKPADGKPVGTDGKPAGTDGKPAGTDGKPADAVSVVEAGGTPCGTSSCSGLQVCVGKTPVGPTTTYSCETVIKGCEGASLRTCACLGKALCVGAFDTCVDSKLPNTIICECPNCQ